MTRFRLAHISDSHLCVTPNRRNRIRLFRDPPARTLSNLFSGKLHFFPASYDDDVLESAARFLFERQRTLDGIVFTGDIGTTGTALDVAESLHFVKARSSTFVAEGKATLGFVLDKMSLMPGNHDRYQNNAGRPGGRNFDLAFENEWQADYPGAKINVFAKNQQHLVIASADFCLIREAHASPAVWPLYMGQGKVYAAVLAKLEALTTQARATYENAVIVWAIHFPAVDPCPTNLKLIDAGNLCAAATRLNIPLILSGHLHHVSGHVVGDRTHLFAAGSMSSADDGDNLWLHTIELEIEGGSLLELSRTNFKYDDEEDEFVQSGGRANFDFR